MNPENWRKISELFEAALERPVDGRCTISDAPGLGPPPDLGALREFQVV